MSKYSIRPAAFLIQFSIFLSIGLIESHFGFTQDSAKSETSPPPVLQNLKSRMDDLSFGHFVERSTREAELFRRSLIARRESPGGLNSIALACKRFQAAINQTGGNQVSESEHSDVGNDLSRFQLDQTGIENAIIGTEKAFRPNEFYGSFEGKWFGIWDGKKVDHHWGGYESLESPREIPIADQSPVMLLGYQYAWVGDGYGLNHVATTADGKLKYLLGYVTHIRDQDLTKEVARRPHVGVLDSPGRLIWITKREVFFEELIRGQSRDQDRYFISGFNYTVDSDSLLATEGFQAIYSRDKNKRVDWRKLAIDLKVVVKEK